MKHAGMVIGGIIVVVLLAAAAFVGFRLLNAPEQVAAAEGGRGGRSLVLAVDDGSGPSRVQINIEPAPELPDRQPEASGLFVRRQDNSLIVGTGAIELDVEVNGATGERSVVTRATGPELEVVVTGDTVVYRDETEMSPGEPSQRRSGERTITQALRPNGSIEEIGANTELQVWGQRRGDRVVADVLVYRLIEG